MYNIFFQTICRVGIFMICAQAIVHFRPQETYEKYLKLLVSIMVLIQLFLPVGSLLFGDGGQETAQALEQFKQELEESMREAEKNAQYTDALLQQATLEEVRRQVQAMENGLENSGEGGGEAPEASGGAEENAAGERNGIEIEVEINEVEIKDIDPVGIGREE